MKRERGFALLLVVRPWRRRSRSHFYRELPRVALRVAAQQGAIADRSRASSIYRAISTVRPQDEERILPRSSSSRRTNQIRFLRKRYADPMTGKAEWRTDRTSTRGQVCTSDSLVHKPPAAKEEEKSVTRSPTKRPRRARLCRADQDYSRLSASQSRVSARGCRRCRGRRRSPSIPTIPQQQPQQPVAGQFPEFLPVGGSSRAYNPAINPGGFNPVWGSPTRAATGAAVSNGTGSAG
jgi:hypothetical protein